MPFKHLLSPLQIGSLEIRNRIVFPPMDLALRHESKAVHPKYVEFMCGLAEDNGVGLIISEFTSVANSEFWAPASRFYSDDFIPEFRAFARQVKSRGARFFMQLALLGGRAPEGRLIAPSAIESPLYMYKPEELSQAEIKELVQKWIEAAIRAKGAGFDGVEVHGGHSYLIGQFLSPHANHREDEYGYDFNGRMKFPTEIVRGIKAACGESFPVGFKFSAYEALENGITGPLAIDIARRLEKIGVNYLHVSSSTYMLAGATFPDVPSIYTPEGPLVALAAKIRRGVEIPVLTVAGIVTPQFAEDILRDGKCDLVAIGRGMFADPQWASKVFNGNAATVRPCIRCNFCHKKMIIDRAGSVECTVNPGLLQPAPERPTQSLSVIVVGSGPAGLEAALQASARGHAVSLYEREGDLGGNLRLAAIPPFKVGLKIFLKYYEDRLAESTVDFFPNRALSAQEILEMKPDIVILAVGSQRSIPDIPGLGEANVVTAQGFLQADSGWQKKMKRVGVIGAGLVGCEIALHISKLGGDAYLLDILPYDEWLKEDHSTNRLTLLDYLHDEKVTILDKATITEIEGSSHMRVTRGDMEFKISLDCMVLAAGFHPEEELKKKLQALKNADSFPEIYNIGDSREVRDIHGAIHEGYQMGTTI